MLPSEFPQAFDRNTCPRKMFFYNCEVLHMSGDILNADENVEYKDEYGFTGLFFKNSPINIDDTTKIQLMNMQRTPESNIDEHLLNNSISEDVH